MKGILHDPGVPSNSEQETQAKYYEQRATLLLFLALSLEVSLTASEISEEDLHLLEVKIMAFLSLHRESLGLQYETASQTGLRTPKWHATKHYPQLIRRFGNTFNYFGGFLESFLKVLVKAPVVRTTRRHGHYQSEMFTRILEGLVCGASKTRVCEESRRERELAGLQDEENDANTTSTSRFTVTSRPHYSKVNGKTFFLPHPALSATKTPTGKWLLNYKGQQFDPPIHPGYPSSTTAKDWIRQILLFASSSHDKVHVHFYYHVKTPSTTGEELGGGIMHDIFRCHPNFHESPTEGARPWHDWAMVDYSHPSTAGIVSVAARVLVWASLHTFQNPNPIPDENETETELYALANPLASYTRNPDAYLPFGQTDRLSPNLEVIPFESIKGTAWVVPINFKRTDPFPKEERITQSPLSELSPTDAFFVVPPRSTWQYLCWEHHLIKPHMATAQDVFDHKIKVGSPILS